MKNKFSEYIDKFNADDNEYYKQLIDNEHAKAWLEENVPMIDIPDKTLEQIYYFRWWVYRKHVKSTKDGYVVTEFLPPVPWAGKHNTIVAAAGFHTSEGKWLKCGGEILKDYLKFWLTGKSKTYLYSSWIIYSVYELCSHLNDFSFAVENLELLISYYEKTAQDHASGSGLFWSLDDKDAMEYSVSGTTQDLTPQKGIRPTLNSYMAANALALSEIAALAGRADIAREYKEKYLDIKEKINSILWNDGFYRAIHYDIDSVHPDYGEVPESQRAKELIGYIPWWFGLAPEGYDSAFEELKKTDGFLCDYGLTTCEQRHPRFLYECNHECLWNGYIWPFATSETLYAMLGLLENYEQKTIGNEDFYRALKTYAESHYLTLDDDKRVCWIDEVKSPRTNRWCSRDILEDWGWLAEKGGFERGKDYNHSAFCDLVLTGLLGLKVKGGQIVVNPRIPEDWDHFKVENLWVGGKEYSVVYDKTGAYYGTAAGITVCRTNR